MTDNAKPRLVSMSSLHHLQTEHAYQRLIESVEDYAILMLNPQGLVATWNVGAQRISGYTGDEIVGEHFSRFYPADTVASGWPATVLRRAAAEGRFEDESWRVRKDGTRYWANVVVTALRETGGTLLGFAMITRDLSERRKHEERLKQSEENLRSLVAGVRDYAIFRLDVDGTVASWNEGAERINGYAAHEIVGRHFSTFYRQEEIQRGWPQEELRLAAELGRFEDEGWRVCKNGSLIWANVVITAIRDAEGRLQGYSKITRDLSERRRQEQALRQSEEHLRQLIEGVADYAIFRLDPDGTVATWNLGAQRIKGYSAGEIIGQHFSKFYREEDLARRWPEKELTVAARVGRFEDEGWRVKKDGSRFWANVVITAIRDDKGELLGFSKITRDLSERRRHEERLRESEENLRLLIENVKNHAFFMCDAEGTITEWNAGAERVFGYGYDDIVGRSIAVLSTPEDRASGRPERDLATTRELGSFEETTTRMRQDGARFAADVTFSPLIDMFGKSRGFAVTVRDLSELRRVQELETEGRRMTEFIAMLAHELRNPLAPIANAASILDKIDGDARAKWCASMIERQVGHLSRLVDDLLDVGRITSGKIQLRDEPVDLNALVAQNLESLRPVIEPFRHTLSSELCEEPLTVRGDPTRLTQVLTNLVVNSAKYTADGGRIEVKLSRHGNFACLVVADNGIGMAPDLLRRAFDLFTQGPRTLERKGGGMGIGLTLVKQIALLHGGSVSAHSDGPGQGTRMVVQLPLA